MQGTWIVSKCFGAVIHGQSPLISRCKYLLDIVNQPGFTFYLITWSDN